MEDGDEVIDLEAEHGEAEPRELHDTHAQQAAGHGVCARNGATARAPGGGACQIGTT
ncbi:MAG: hypothetical protein KF773_39700 [Deltaproteobacteria bacterium]|nr:hypothetical protein [Deltaproteobacteria bacterium]